MCEYLPEKILKKIKEGVSCDKIYSSSFLKKNKKVRFPENIVYAEDILFSYFALTRCHKVVFTKGSFYYWLRRLSSISFVSSEEKRADNALKVLYAIFNDLVKNKATQDLAGITLNWALPYLEMFAFKEFNNIEIFNQKLQEYYPRLRIK